MEVDITGSINKIDFYPSDVYHEIIQNIKIICSTPKYSVPLDRAFGIDASILDRPLNYAQAKLSAEIIEAINNYEPRAKVKSVNFSGDGLTGLLIPTVKIELQE